MHAGVIQAEADPSGDHVLRERLHQNQQVISNPHHHSKDVPVAAPIPTHLTPVLPSVSNLIRCLEEGAEDFLVKPVRASDVSRVFSRVLR